jgi:hypothetical protein
MIGIIELDVSASITSTGNPGGVIIPPLPFRSVSSVKLSGTGVFAEQISVSSQNSSGEVVSY